MRIPILILAAGAGTRMRGCDKLLEPVGENLPLLLERVMAAQATGQTTIVALPQRSLAPKRWQCLAGKDVQIVEILAIDQGMSASLIGLVQALPSNADGAMILPADMPDITTHDMQTVLAAFTRNDVIRGSANNKPGHPVLFPKGWFPRLLKTSGDIGARDLLKASNPKLVALQGSRALTDLDTPEDWAVWRAEKRAP